MKSTVTMLAVAVMVIAGSNSSFAADELYLIDLRETPGKILLVQDVSWSRNPVLRPVYARPSQSIYTMAFHKYSSPRFVDLEHRNIYATDGQQETKVFSFSTPIQDIDYDSRGRMYFSAIGGDEGTLYFLNPHNGDTSKVLALSFRSLAEKTRGFWNGYFAFDPSDRIYLSIDGPQPGGSSLYEYDRGQLKKRFTHNERITGFTFVDENTIYFTNAGNRVYQVRNFSDVSVRHEEAAGRMLNDVELVKVPDRGACTISGRLRGGRDLLPMASVQALGPNVLWRSSPGSTARVSGDGNYVLRNLPNGRYRVSADISGDTMAGYEPRARMVNCGGAVQNVDFQFSR